MQRGVITKEGEYIEIVNTTVDIELDSSFTESEIHQNRNQQNNNENKKENENGQNLLNGVDSSHQIFSSDDEKEKIIRSINTKAVESDTKESPVKGDKQKIK